MKWGNNMKSIRLKSIKLKRKSIKLKSIRLKRKSIKLKSVKLTCKIPKMIRKSPSSWTWDSEWLVGSTKNTTG